MAEASTQQVETFLRYMKESKEFEFKMTENGAVIAQKKFPEKDIPGVRAAMSGKMQELFDFLVTEAKKDPEERFVSASNAPVKDGQATVG